MKQTIHCDVAIVGAGIAGASIARELARYQLRTHVFEASYDVACGASRTNSGIVHGGYDPEPGTNKAYYNVAGARMIPQLAQELGFRYQNNGSMVNALSDEEVAVIDELVARGKKNGVESVRAVGPDEACSLEPNLSPEVKRALVCESSGICDPFGMVVAYAENAAVNGVNFHFSSPVIRIERTSNEWQLSLATGDTVFCAAVVNAAGIAALEFHNQVSADKHPCAPRRGEYVLLSRDCGPRFSHTMFQAPGVYGKGILVSPTVEGNLIVGPNSLAADDPSDTATRPAGLAEVIEQAKRTWPALETREIIVNFAGVRPSGAAGDFVIGEVADAPGFFEVAAFDSPGLSSAAAIAPDIAAMVAERLHAARNTKFVPERTMPARFIEMDADERRAAIAQNPAFSQLVCRCEEVTEAEVLAAIHAPIPATSITAVKRRCRAGTGRCQGGFCMPVVAEILSRELNIELSEVRLAGEGTEVAPFRIGELKHV